MIFNKLHAIAKNNPNKLALNNYTYGELLDLVDNYPYSLVCEHMDYNVIIHVLKAMKLNKPVIILPKTNRDSVEMPENVPDNFCVIMFSSGSSGKRKCITLPESMILANAENAITAQNLCKIDKILTVCSLCHTGGLNAQLIGGLLIGAHNIIESFNAFSFYRIVKEQGITITHLIPPMVDALIKVDSQLETPTLKLVACGSDCVYKHHIKHFLDKNIVFISNYGMTEAGPIIINITHYPGDDLSLHDNGVVLGNRHYAAYKIIDNELYLKGSAINIPDWLRTGDCVREERGTIYYLGRKSAGCKIIPKQY